MLVSVISLIAALGSMGMQYIGGMEPCPLCITQRLIIMMVGILALCTLGLAEREVAKATGALVTSLIALAGLGVSMRHLWIQSDFGQTAQSCGPGMGSLIDTLPAWKVIVELLGGTGDCANVSPVFGLPIPLWSAMVFIAVITLLQSAYWRYQNNR
mgnify:CR=1 FL=1